MPTQSTTYNTRLTDETLEKRFRDTFRSQGGAELVDDLYASGVIVPVVDFTSAAEGSALRPDLQTSWDFASGQTITSNTTSVLISTPGFWKVQFAIQMDLQQGSNADAEYFLSDGLTTRLIWNIRARNSTGTFVEPIVDQFVVYLRSGDTFSARADTNEIFMSTTYRQIADVSGDLTQPSGFVAS